MFTGNLPQLSFSNFNSKCVVIKVALYYCLPNDVFDCAQQEYVQKNEPTSASLTFRDELIKEVQVLIALLCFYFYYSVISSYFLVFYFFMHDTTLAQSSTFFILH